ncbi:phage tail tape measure protein [Bacillus atrophaeus]|uniref:phage tail tape measure protein n=1 Tax=Bacillus atrophaeus TaxID=1452 RepID=UPI002E1F2A63|nr:transglycosylase SLT domain-containing protein [Bacillus atrophaeus]MED4814238.1 transglycosylase SLT domain-containing protein [Bacillus atrophaeus]MED4826268.1 transglycosylase SLT domain-containing protein [Bacillus atrophaeus]MED4844928.1 transglycosylase SLT domain-containing protein [Bacillus atrophaeus]
MAKLTATFDLHDKMTKKLRKIQGNAERLQRAANGPLIFEADDRTQRTIRRIDRSASQLTRRPRSLDVRLDDQASGGLTRIRRQTEDITEGEHEVRVSVEDRATPRLRLIRGSLSDLDRSDTAPTVSVRDRASGDLNSLRHRVSDLDGSEATPTVSIRDKASAALDAIEKRLDGLKTVTITLAAAGGLSGGAIMNLGKNAMAQDAYVSATSNVSKKDAARMTDDIFYKNKVGGSREEVSSALKGLSQLTGASDRALAELTESSSKVAQLMNADQAEVDRAFSAMYNNLKMTGKESGDTIAYIYRNAGDQADDLLDTMNEYSSTFKDMKLTGGQIANAMIKGTKGGARNFDNLADSMREFNIRRTEMSDNQVAAFEQLFGGKETQKMFKGFKDGSISGQESLFKVADALSKVKDKTKRAAIATELIGTQYEDLKQPILDMAEGIGTSAKTTGELNRSFTQLRNNNPMTPVNDALRDFESISKDMGTSLLTGLGPAFDKISDFLNSKEGKEKLKEIKADITDLGEAIGDKLNKAIEFTVNHWDELKTAFKVVVPPLIGLIAYLKILRPLLKGIGTAGGDAARVIKSLIPTRSPSASADPNTRSGRRNGRSGRRSPTSIARSGSLTGCCCAGGFGGEGRASGRQGGPARRNPTRGTISVPADRLGRQSGRTGSGSGAGRVGVSTTRTELRSAGQASSKMGKILKPLSGVGKFAKGIPLLGTALAATGLIGMNKDNAGEKLGSFGGNMAGAAAGGATGAAIGSVVPVVGTAVGGVVGSIAGGIGGSDLGSSIGKWFDDGGASKAWDGIVDGAEKAVDWISDTWSDFSDWFMDNVWNPVSDWAGDKIDKITKKFEDAKKWLTDTWNDVSSWFVDNVWTPIYNTAVPIINLVVGAFLFAWDGIKALWKIVSTWFMDNVWDPLVDGVTDAADWIWKKINDAWKWISDVWSTVSTWFMDNVWTPVSDAVTTAANWIWTKLNEAWTFISGLWSTVSTWFMDNVWTPVSDAVTTAANWIWTKLNEAWTWISDKWSAVSAWFSENVWNPIVSKVEDAKKSISEKFESAKKAVKDAWNGISEWFSENVGDPLEKIADGIKKKFEDTFWWVIKLKGLADAGGEIIGNIIGRGEEATGLTTKKSGKSSSGKNTSGGGGIAGLVQSQSSGPTSIFPKQKSVLEKNATGGYITKPTISWIGEAGKEFVIPVDNNKGRGKMLLSQAASKLGLSVVDDMASASSAGGETAVSPLAGGATVSATVSPTVDTSSLNEQATSFGQQFTQGFDQGIGDNVVSMDAWKQKNIGQPFNNLISYSPNYGKQVVNGYAKGQNTTTTGTDGFLQSKVKTPYQATVNKSSSWGTGTVKGFAAGQNGSQTGTSQYVSTHVEKPFLRSKESSNGWGTGMIGNFVSGMTSKGSEVHEAAKELAKKVEKAFREELDIHSPSRVMMSLGRFASVGVVKGLDSVDVKKYAEKQAGSLAAAYSGMGAVGGNVKQWLMAAMMATKTPLSWLPGLMTIAQHESGGNPNSINLWDSNAKAGNPSQGLMQTVPTTFNAHKAPGMGNIRNPIHNAAAAIGYIKSRYGSIDNVPGIKSLRHGGPYVGYANGGLITKEQIARVGEGNKREWIIPEERGIRGRYLLGQAANALGMEVSDPAQTGQAELSSGQLNAATSGSTRTPVAVSGGKEVVIQFNGDQHFHNDQDTESLIEKIKQALINELEQDINIGTKGVVAYD